MTSVDELSKEPDAIPKDGSAHPAAMHCREEENPDRLMRPGFDAG